MNNCIFIDLITERIWTNSSKVTVCQIQEERSYPNSPISITEIELIIDNLCKQKATGANGFTDGFCQVLGGEIISIFHISFIEILLRKIVLS